MAKATSVRRTRQMVRILGILRALLDGEKTTVQDFATSFGTRRETIYRDIRAIEDAGYPLVGDELGRLSHPRLLPTGLQTTPLLRFTDNEIKALLWVAQQAGEASAFRDELASASGKLRTMASQAAAPSVAGIDQALAAWGGGEKDYAPHKISILRLLEAIIEHRQCSVAYQSPSSAKPRSYRYNPYRLITAGGDLYCIGRVPPHENLTTLAVDRIHSLEITDEQFEVDPSFDLERYRRDAFGVIREEPMDVRIRFSAEQAPYVRERTWHPSQIITDAGAGRVDLAFRAGGSFEIIRWILGWGEAAEVLSPPELRKWVRSALEAASKRYVDDKMPG